MELLVLFSTHILQNLSIPSLLIHVEPQALDVAFAAVLEARVSGQEELPSFVPVLLPPIRQAKFMFQHSQFRQLADDHRNPMIDLRRVHRLIQLRLKECTICLDFFLCHNQ